MLPSLARDQENTIRTLVTGSPVSSTSSRLRASRISAASAASGRPGRATARAATSHRASGRRPHSAISSLTAAGSAIARPAPRFEASRSCDSASVSTPSVIRCAPSAAARPVSRFLLVTSTRHPGDPGSNGRTCSAF